MTDSTLIHKTFCFRLIFQMLFVLHRFLLPISFQRRPIFQHREDEGKIATESITAFLSALFSKPFYYLSNENEKAAANRAAKQEQTCQQLLTDYGNSILRLAYSYLHNMSDAEEILQDTLIQFIKAAPIFENKAHEKAWLMRVAANLSKNRINYNKIRATDELSETLAADQQEDLSFVWEAMKSLPPKYREVIHLFYYEGYSTAEIAALLKRNESTIRSFLYRGREKLKEILKELYDFDKTL